MNIELDTEWLKSINLTPNEYVYLLWLYKKCKEGDPGTFIFGLSIGHLQTLGYVKIVKGSPAAQVVLRQKFIDLVEGDFDKMFNELLATYPMKVGVPQNYRILHAVDAKAKANKRSRERYKRIVEGKPHVHRRIMKALDTQLKQQRQKLQYMQMLEVWINNATWEKWEGFEEDIDESRNTKVLN